MAHGSEPKAQGPWPMAQSPRPKAHGPWLRAQGPRPMAHGSEPKAHTHVLCTSNGKARVSIRNTGVSEIHVKAIERLE